MGIINCLWAGLLPSPSVGNGPVRPLLIFPIMPLSFLEPCAVLSRPNFLQGPFLQGQVPNVSAVGNIKGPATPENISF